MPSPSEILATLTRIANEGSWVAIVWHGIVLVVGIALALGFRPSTRQAAVGLVLPLSSVSVSGWWFDSPFNGTVFAVATLVMMVFALESPATRIVPSRPSSTLGVLGGALVAFGWVYPHFLADFSPVVYLYAAPLGVLPCPTIALVSGATLLVGDLVAPKWRLALAGLGAFYALFGVFRLGVSLDVLLLLAPLGLSLQHFRARRARHAALHPS
jgi:hypothetical protein